MTIFLFSDPNCRFARGCNGTSFTTGSLLRAMMTSSPAIACSISFESFVLAAWTYRRLSLPFELG
jgi:hypothetical protein